MIRHKSDLEVTDMFAGVGGSSSGAEKVPGVKIAMAINHWKLAVESHNSNFPHAKHDCVDIQGVTPRRYGRTAILIASPECTNHSLAKGKRRKNIAQLEMFGKVVVDPAEERSRATMFDVVRFAEEHRYDIVIVENVVDVRLWELFDGWIKCMTDLGYLYEAVYLNSMFAHDLNDVVGQGDFAPQSRDRVYFVFWRKGNKRPNLRISPKAWCEKCGADVESVQSWRNPERKWGKYGRQYDYRCPTCASLVKPYYFAAANAIDWTIPAERIGDRKRPLKPRTLERIQLGLEKFGNEWMILHTDHLGPKNTHPPRPLSREMPTQPARAVMGLAMPIQINLTQDQLKSAAEAAYTQVGSAKYGLAFPSGMLVSLEYTHGHNNRATAVTDPYPTAKTTTMPAFVGSMPFLSVQFTPGYNKPVTDSFGTVTAQDHHALIQAPFISMFRTNSVGTSMTDPMATMVAGGCHHGLIIPQPFMFNYYTNDSVRSLSEASSTMTASNQPGVTWPQLTRKVDDCCFRMVQPKEIKAAMGFVPGYIVLGGQKDQVRQLGNAVTPPAMKLLIERCAETLR